MFSKVLIANRGVISRRITRTLHRLGVGAVAVYSEADADSIHVREADEAVLLGPPPVSESYLRVEKILDAARRTGAQAIHPGYGFLSENADFAEACEQAGLAFIGPTPEQMRVFGLKHTARAIAEQNGVPLLPGTGLVASADAAAVEVERIGYPVMLKSTAGGGGIGMRVCWNRAELADAFASVERLSRSNFKDSGIFLEKFVAHARHIEVQIFGDGKGRVLALGERDCSTQRRNQKVIEEAPSPLLDEATRAAMGAQAVALAKAVNYDSAGTVEFVAGQDKSFFFLEMNTRLQVEHPVTELITGLDLVEQMIRSAYGEKLAFSQKDLKINGWAMESRIYAEDPYRGFLPSIGRLVRYSPPREGDVDGAIVRNDAGVREGDEISMYYDPMISKLSTWAPSREGAIDAMGRALEDFHIEGLGQNIPFLSAVMDQARFRSGQLSTNYIKDEFPDGFQGLRRR